MYIMYYTYVFVTCQNMQTIINLKMLTSFGDTYRTYNLRLKPKRKGLSNIYDMHK